MDDCWLEMKDYGWQKLESCLRCIFNSLIRLNLDTYRHLLLLPGKIKSFVLVFLISEVLRKPLFL